MTRRFDTWEQMEACHAEERMALANRLSVQAYRNGVAGNEFESVGKTKLDLIVESTCKSHGINYTDLVGNCRFRRFTVARNEAYYIAQKAGFSLAEIGSAFGGRDHATIRSGIRRHEETVQ
ncbi:helix-turn-helix domain-containing protein [Ruegeria sp. HKCCD6109]|uniref:helix-turn-helix domain-containing protein n=1 Tax=Ruegeria sp. HKCCD6109 TaxID=2683017 RepID=UPI0014910FCB|nr:helix-turn-helix domain-containing protein [Ruegeria sp. HKCCD6109]NOD65797.1 hypothetical protein [Ruegeria sp. HKCCD6109]